MEGYTNFIIRAEDKGKWRLSPKLTHLLPGLPLRVSEGDREMACRRENKQGQKLGTGPFLGSLGPNMKSRPDSHAWPTAASQSEQGPWSISHCCSCQCTKLIPSSGLALCTLYPMSGSLWFCSTGYYRADQDKAHMVWGNSMCSEHVSTRKSHLAVRTKGWRQGASGTQDPSGQP